MQESVNKDREKYIGGSDIAAIMELSPFKKRYDLLLEKAGYKESDFKGNVFTDYGNQMEPIIRDYINGKESIIPTEKGFIEGKHVREAENGEIIGVRIHTDGETDNAILEIKTTSEIFDKVDDYKIYLVQLLFYMVNTDKPFGLLAVYERPEDLSLELDPERLHIYPIRLEDYTDLVEEISDNLDRFIDDLYKVKNNPFITEADLLPSEITDIARRILAFEDQLKYMKEIESKISSEKERLKIAMDAAGVPTWKTPNGYIITRVKDGEDKVTESEELDLDALKRDLPDLFKKIDDGGYLVIKRSVKKGSKGYVKITPPKKKKEE